MHPSPEPLGQPRVASGRLFCGLCLCLLLIAMILSACGGGSSTADPPTSPPAPGPGSSAGDFTLLPARMGLVTGANGQLYAPQPPGALTWSSSNPGVATVDAQGQVTALAAGGAVITARSGTAQTTSAVTVYASTATTGTALIATALALHRISAEQALTYKVYALFGDTRLPLEFEGAPNAVPNHLLLREMATTINTLSPATQALLRPFLLPPIDAGSWYAQRLGLTAAAPAGVQRAEPAKKNRLDAPAINCQAVGFPYQEVSTEHFTIHSLGGAAAVNGTAEVVTLIASLVEDVYSAETDLLKRFPLDDSQRACNGGGAKYDIYYIPGALGGLGAWTTSYPLDAAEVGVASVCANRPSYTVLNSVSAEFLTAARQPDDARLMVKSILAHEFLHALQFGMPRAASCTDTAWFDEATAQWAMDHVVPKIAQGLPGEFGLEPGIGNLASGYPKSGPVLAEYLYSDHLRSIEKPGAVPELNGYADYLFFQYVARTQTPAKIKQIFDAMAGGKNSVEAIAAAVDMKATWPEFAKTLWIGVTDKLLDYWNTEDDYRFGLADVYAQVPTTGVPAELKDRLKSLKIDQKGEKSATFELLQNALTFEGDYVIEPRSVLYEHLKFTDATVHYVEFSNPIVGDPNNGGLKLQALKKIAGQWQAPEVWTDDAFKLFCLDKKSERLEELLLIVSDSDANRATEVPFHISPKSPMRVSTSNVGCWRWQGTASQTTNEVQGPLREESVAAAVFDVWRFPGQARDDLVGLDSFKSSNTGTASYRIGGPLIGTTCTITGDASAALQGDGNLLADGGFIVNYLLADERLNRMVIGSGTTNIPAVSETVVCAGSTGTSTGPKDVRWLAWPEEGVPVSADGQSIVGSWDRTDSEGTKKSVWNFKAMREE